MTPASGPSTSRLMRTISTIDVLSAWPSTWRSSGQASPFPRCMQPPYPFIIELHLHVRSLLVYLYSMVCCGCIWFDNPYPAYPESPIPLTLTMRMSFLFNDYIRPSSLHATLRISWYMYMVHRAIVVIFRLLLGSVVTNHVNGFSRIKYPRPLCAGVFRCRFTVTTFTTHPSIHPSALYPGHHFPYVACVHFRTSSSQLSSPLIVCNSESLSINQARKFLHPELSSCLHIIRLGAHLFGWYIARCEM